MKQLLEQFAKKHKLVIIVPNDKQCAILKLLSNRITLSIVVNVTFNGEEELYVGLIQQDQIMGEELIAKNIDDANNLLDNIWTTVALLTNTDE